MGSQPNVSSVWLFDDYSLSSPEGSNGCHTREDVGLALAHEQLRHSGWYISKGQCWECYNTKNSSGTGLLELPLSQCAGFCFLPTPPHLASYIHGYTTQVRLVEVGGGALPLTGHHVGHSWPSDGKKKCQWPSDAGREAAQTSTSCRCPQAVHAACGVGRLAAAGGSVGGLNCPPTCRCSLPLEFFYLI
jgi:hypothetical protein